MSKFSVVFIKNGNLDEDRLFHQFKNNHSYIKEIITNVPLPPKFSDHWNIKTIKENYPLNNIELTKSTESEYFLLIDTNTELEEETLEEYAELLEENDYDIIYPNIVLKLDDEEKVINYEDWEDRNEELIQALRIEQYLPQWGVLIKKEAWERFGGFEERYGDFALYAFVYKNLPHLKLKNSDLSFVNYHINQSFIDTSYRSRLLRDIVKQYDLKRLFQFLDWNNEAVAMATAYTLIGDALVKYMDYFNATHFYRQALLVFHNQESLKKLVEAYTLMGLFDEANKMIQTQHMTDIVEGELRERVDNAQKIVTELEIAIEKGKANDILAASNDIISYYDGAPIYNILGIVYFIQKDIDNAYKFFYKATTMNPIDQDILYNLIESAKKLGRESEAINLLERITK